MTPVGTGDGKGGGSRAASPKKGSKPNTPTTPTKEGVTKSRDTSPKREKGAKRDKGQAAAAAAAEKEEVKDKGDAATVDTAVSDNATGVSLPAAADAAAATVASSAKNKTSTEGSGKDAGVSGGKPEADSTKGKDGEKKEIVGTKKGKKDEDKEERRERVANRWWRALQGVVLRYREDQLSRLKDFVYVKVEVKDSKKTKISTSRRPQDILAENLLKEKLKKQEEYVYQENMRFQNRIGLALYQLGDYYKALSFFERVCNKEALIEENDEQRARRLKAEQVARDLAKVEELQKRMNTKKLKGKKAEEAKAAELEKQIRIAKEQKAAEKEKRRRAKQGLAEPEEGEEELDLLHKDYKVHYWAGMCCLRLFETSKQHYHLDKAYAHLTHSVECMTVPRPGYDLSTMLRLPTVLLQLGRVYEGYGAHDSALQMYSKIMQEYPHCRCYFDTMYRAALMGKYISDHSSNEQTKQEMLNRCIDMLQFLLEALPESLNETQTILLYAKCLEKSSDPAIRYRAKAAYESLFAHCNQAKIANAHNYKISSEWEKDAENWQKLAEIIGSQHEPLLAKEGYETFVAKVNSRRMPGKELSTYIELPTLIQIALNYSHFQNFKLATKYADMALSKDRLNPQVRALISKWSKSHADKLAKEVKSVNTLHARWTERAWTETARAKLKAAEIVRLEALYKSSRFNQEARSLLSYYARDEWRAKFLFESACAVRVQRFVRNKFVCWKVQEKFRSVYLSRASQAYTMFNRRPFDPKLRNEVRAVCKSRFCPRKHAIRRVKALMETQDESAVIMGRSFRAYRTRRQIIASILNTKRKRDQKLNECAVTLQCLVRMKLATVKVQLEIIQWARKAVASKVIQQYVRWRNKTFQHAAWQLIYKRRAVRARAMDTFLVIFSYQCRRKLIRKHMYFAERQAALIQEERIRQVCGYICVQIVSASAHLHLGRFVCSAYMMCVV